MKRTANLYEWGIDLERIVSEAERSYASSLITITEHRAPTHPGGLHDYYSNGDYWWPNPDTADGLPYVRRDGQSYPGAFHAHRLALRGMRTHAANLAAAYALTGQARYARKAAEFIRCFFLDAATRMNPDLQYAQAIPGVCTGRGIGIIDTLHLIDIPAAAAAIKPSGELAEEEYKALQQWFADYLNWLLTHPYGVQEQQEANNHAICWYVQAAAFARFTGDTQVLQLCRDRYRDTLLPQQMAPDGSFPLELARTKPYSYSLFALDNMTVLCQLLSDPGDDLWRFELPDGRGIRRALDYLYPYVADKTSWPLPPDVEKFGEWPVRMPYMLYAGAALGDDKHLQLWRTLEPNPADAEVRRNIGLRQPLLWLLPTAPGQPEQTG